MLKKGLKLCMLLALVGLVPAVAQAQEGRAFKATLVGYEEVPALSVPASGTFSLVIGPDETSFDFTLTYSGISGTGATQSHIHFEQKANNGNILVFFCTNLGNGPMGTQLCPANGTVTGTVTAADVVNNAVLQGIAAGQFDEVLAAIRAGTVYVNVHSSAFPGGEIRGQLLPGGGPK